MVPKFIEHIGIAVKNIENARKFYEEILGMECYLIEEVKDQKVKTAFFKIGESKIELMEPTSDNSPIAKFITKRGEGLHHIAYKVENLKDKIFSMQDSGIHLIDKTSRTGAENLKIAFIHPKSTYGVLTELCE